MNKNGIIWSAGLFDGEGCILINRVGRQHILVARVVMTNKPTVDKLKEIYGGTMFSHKSKHKRQWIWVLTRKKAAAFLEVIRPYSVAKLPEIDVALEFQSVVVPRGSKHPLTDEDFKVRDQYRQRLQYLKTVEFKE